MNLKNHATEISKAFSLIALPIMLAACGTSAQFGGSESSQASTSAVSGGGGSTVIPVVVATPVPSSTAYTNSCSGTNVAPAVPAITTNGICAVKVMSLPIDQGLALAIPDGSGNGAYSLSDCKSIAKQFQANYSNVCVFYITSSQAQSIGASLSNADATVQAIIQNFSPVATSN